jgi:hypothetical protein
MANETMTLIASSTVGAGGAGSIDFTSIPQTYTDLLVKVSGRDGRASVGGFLYVKFNNSSTGYANSIWLRGLGNSVNSDLDYAGTRINLNFVNTGTSATASTFGNVEIYVPNYALTTANKLVSVDGVTENNATSAFDIITATGWNNTSAITQLTLYPTDATNFAQYSSASLYGILKGSGGATVS